MQRKYNMALQHFYQAATHSTDDQASSIKAKLKEISDDSEEDLYVSERYKEECFEMKDLKNNENDENNFKFKNKLQVKRVKPGAICSRQGCILLCGWFFIFVISLIGLTYFIQLAVSHIDPKRSYETYRPLTIKKHTNDNNSKKIEIAQQNRLESCTKFEVKPLWHTEYMKFCTQSPIRLIDLNKDGIDDTVMGFSTKYDDVHKIGEAKDICDKYSPGLYPCFGGVVANDGVSGAQLWIHYTSHEIYSVNCNGDINKDGIPDCLCAGRRGVFQALDGKRGTALWEFSDKNFMNENMNLHSPQFIYDIDHDGVMDILQMHGGSPLDDFSGGIKLPGRIMFLSGKSGTVIKSLTVPDHYESSYSPLIYLVKNGTEMLIFGTGSEAHAGNLYVIQLKDLLNSNFKNMRQILTNPEKGFLRPPILVDVNGDGVVDLINAGFSENVTAIDGETLKVLWTFQQPSTETYSIPGTGYYNEDNVVDFLVRVNYGSGFPTYFNSKVFILDGKTGKPIGNEYKTSVAVHSSPLSVSMEGVGNDMFLYWVADCKGHENEGGDFQYVEGTNIRDSSLYDSCLARFDTKSVNRLYVTNKKIGLPGKELYSSENAKDLNVDGGLQPIIQTGAVASSIHDGIMDEFTDKFDVIFATYSMGQPKVRAIRPDDMICIENVRKNVQQGKISTDEINRLANNKNGFQDNGDAAVNYCLKRNIPNSVMNEKLTLHRYQITCKCEKDSTCARVLPQQEQGWSGYMGSLSNGYFKNRVTLKSDK